MGRSACREGTALRVTGESCDPDVPVLVQALGARTPDVVPEDQALCAVGAACQLSLDAGTYEMSAWSESEWLGRQSVDVTPDDMAALDVGGG